jgi:membrane-bound ClpP family serine protease
LTLLQRVAGAVLGVVLFVLALVFTSVILAVAGAIALVAGAWLWSRTRDVRRAAQQSRGTLIEGEYRVERETRRLDDRA